MDRQIDYTNNPNKDRLKRMQALDDSWADLHPRLATLRQREDRYRFAEAKLERLRYIKQRRDEKAGQQ